LSTTTPVLVADAPVLHIKRLGRTVRGAFVGQRTAGREIAVLHPVPKLFRRAAAHIAREIRLRSDQSAQADKFMRAETVVVDGVAPA
jgi:hypothetical protein